MCVSVSDSAVKQWSPPAWLLSAASYADNSFYWPLLIINESSKNSICFIAGQQVFKGRRQQLNCAAAIILLRMQFYIFPRRCLQLNWGNGTLFIFTASPLRSRLASLLPVSQVVLQTSHRLHNWFSQSRRRPLLGPSPGCTTSPINHLQHYSQDHTFPASSDTKLLSKHKCSDAMIFSRWHLSAAAQGVPRSKSNKSAGSRHDLPLWTWRNLATRQQSRAEARRGDCTKWYFILDWPFVITNWLSTILDSIFSFVCVYSLYMKILVYCTCVFCVCSL